VGQGYRSHRQPTAVKDLGPRGGNALDYNLPDSARSRTLPDSRDTPETSSMTPSRLILIAAAVAVLAGCETAPVTGRKQFLIVPESQAIEASAQAYTQTLAQESQKGKLNTDPALKARVDKITGRLIPQATKYRPETADWQWSVAVIDEPKTLNAWCMAGGRMAIYTGIINQLKLTDDEIAQIMGHEIAHALAKHTAERMSEAVATQTALSIGAALLGGSTKGQLALQGAAIATTVGLQLPNSRRQEAEADRIGIELAAKAGYDPHAAPMLWKKMIDATGSAGKADWLSTHPAGEKRMESLSALIPEMMPYYQDKSPRPTYQFRASRDRDALAWLTARHHASY
jgi:predicted Zn-dependent protease